MTATDRTPPPLKWLCLGNRDANDGFELFAHGIYARNGALVGSKLSLRERRQRVDLSAFLSGAPPLLAEAAVKHLLARLLCVHRHNTDLELLGKNFIPLHASSLGNAGVCERILASARQLQQHQVELCLLLAIDEQEPASAEYLASLARLRDSGVRIALHPQRIDTDARQCFAEVDAGLMGYLLTLWLDERQLQEWGWRIPFAAGLLVLPIGLYIRLNLAETFSGRGRQASTRNLLGELFGNHRRALLLGLLILSGSTITQYFLNYMTTFALTELHLPAGIAMLSTLVAGAALALSALLGGVLCDRYGRRAVLILPRLALLAVLFPALQAMTRHPEPAVFLAVLALLSALHGMSGAALIVLLVESFPRALRSTGFSLVYATGVAAFGGTAQIVVTWLIGVTGNPLSPLGYLLLANLVCLVGAWLARETWPGRGDMGGAPLVLRD
ncbi:hypothetical protein APG03_14700 [Pseudomonas aeruginosa]|nr:hypothetical protein APG03_14700 [Pseudomonas aeruginosa]